jgi:hypothetical protein
VRVDISKQWQGAETVIYNLLIFFLHRCKIYSSISLNSIMADFWPSAPVVVTDQVKHIITRFFDISDSTDPTSGRLFAEELFIQDGFFKTHKTCVFKGHDGSSPVFYSRSRSYKCPNNYSIHIQISNLWSNQAPTEIASSREHNNPIITYRKHHFNQIYAANSPATDLVVLGNFEIGLKDGNSVYLEFTARLVIAEGEQKLRSVEVWTDGQATKAAFEKATKALAAKG